MNVRIQLIVVVVAAAVTAANAATADDKAPELRAAASVGYLADSNVNVSQIDTVTNEGDNAVEYKLALGAQLPVGERVSLDIDYSLDAIRYQQFSDFDLDLHRLAAALNLAAAGFDAAFSAEQFLADLDGDRFLAVRQLTPSLARLMGSKLYLRGAYTLAEKDYDQSPERKGDNRAARVDAYVLLDGMRRFLTLGYVSASENAADEAFDYSGRQLSFGAGQRFGGDDRYLVLRARAMVEQRDFAGITESIGAPRRDERFRADLTATVGLSERWTLEGSAAYSEIDSNVDSAALEETVFLLRAGVSF